MQSNRTLRVRGAGAIVMVLGMAALIAPLPGCSGKLEDRFAAATYDEYTQTLTNAVIGTPNGVITIGPASAPEAGTPGGGGIDSGTFGPDGGGIDAGPSEGGVGGSRFGSWHFDDCSPTSNFLADSSGFGANAQHALGAACVPGISGLGVRIRTAKDIVQVPDEPQFTVGSQVAVAAWVHPTTVGGDQPIVIKRLNNETSFSLGIHNGNIEMSVVLTTGKTIISRAPITPGRWTHVAGMFDGTFVFLFIDGQQFGQVFGAGLVRNVFAPIRIGATTQTQHFNGIIDEVFVSADPISKDALTALSCIHRPSTLSVKPAVGGPVPFDTAVHYDISVANTDVGSCAPKDYSLFSNFFDPTLTLVFNPQFVSSVQPGQTVTFGADVTGTENANPGIHQVPFLVDANGGPPDFSFEELAGQLTFDLAAPTGCFVFRHRELMITDVSVVDDPIRTFGVSTPGGGFDGGVGIEGGAPFNAGAKAELASDASAREAGPPLDAMADASGSPSLGVWTFGHLMREMAPTASSAPAMTLQLFQHWLSTQTVNGFAVAARPAIQRVLLDAWPKTALGELDLDHAPLRLQAIVNRIDVRNLATGSAGEGRFVFAVNGAGFPQSFTVILEYNLPARTQKDVQDWANLWHGLSSHPFPSEQYNAALEAITRRFSGRNSGPGRVNGSNLVELRTNEIALSFQWELRAFALSSTTGFFDETTVKETPDLTFNGTSTFAAFVNQNAAAIIAEVPGANDNTVPLTFAGRSFLAGSVFNNQIEWNAPGISDPEARFHASANTCNGCHGPETGTFNFTMIAPRSAGTEAQLSPFLTGTTVIDPVTRQPRRLNDLARRKADLTRLVCPSDGGSPPPTDAGSPPSDAGHGG